MSNVVKMGKTDIYEKIGSLSEALNVAIDQAQDDGLAYEMILGTIEAVKHSVVAQFYSEVHGLDQ